MRLALLAAVSSLAIAGCASLIEEECRGDWYQIGQRDGRLGASPQLEIYAARCAPVGVQPDAVRYDEGWKAGFGARPVPTW
jgi:hypothetical protein